ncbi:MAG TPA: hypothetical protein VHH73_04620 [Verrucomicrobiae bacterium]|nr:hypothetical protein [Verrucomicrobiae bacterium]
MITDRTRMARETRAFTLFEVMIAIGIFFIAIFAILKLTSQSLQQARSLQRQQVDIGSLAAESSLTNRLEEGVESGSFGDQYGNYSWTKVTTEIASNGLFQVDFTVNWYIDKKPLQTHLSTWLYRPDSISKFR